MPYTGHLISPNTRWLQAIASRMDQRNIFWSHYLEQASRGDPVFIVGSNRDIILHTSINWLHREPLGKSREKYAAALPIAEDETETPSALEETGVAMFLELKPVAPPLIIKTLGIDYRHSEVQPLSAEEVLAVLRALPPSSQTAWTQRVVARSNDLRVDS